MAPIIVYVIREKSSTYSFPDQVAYIITSNVLLIELLLYINNPSE